MGDSARWVVLKSINTPLFSKMRTFVQNSASMVVSGIKIELQPWSPIFRKKVLIFEKKGGC
jgi:hypothetical protein